jgi:hypothetical protein
METLFRAIFDSLQRSDDAECHVLDVRPMTCLKFANIPKKLANSRRQSCSSAACRNKGAGRVENVNTIVSQSARVILQNRLLIGVKVECQICRFVQLFSSQTTSIAAAGINLF